MLKLLFSKGKMIACSFIISNNLQFAAKLESFTFGILTPIIRNKNKLEDEVLKTFGRMKVTGLLQAIKSH